MAKKKKTLPKLKKELQILFNKWIRQRDEGKPCISCGSTNTLQAGHYFSVKMYDSLRFNEDNCHGECAGCNCFNDSHLILYRENLISKIGTINYDALFVMATHYKQHGYKWSRSELEDKIKHYKELLK